MSRRLTRLKFTSKVSTDSLSHWPIIPIAHFCSLLYLNQSKPGKSKSEASAKLFFFHIRAAQCSPQTSNFKVCSSDSSQPSIQLCPAQSLIPKTKELIQSCRSLLIMETVSSGILIEYLDHSSLSLILSNFFCTLAACTKQVLASAVMPHFHEHLSKCCSGKRDTATVLLRLGPLTFLLQNCPKQ